MKILTSWIMFVIALILLGLHSFILVRNYRESKSNLVLTVSILLLINNFASISNVFLYNQMENNVGIVNEDKRWVRMCSPLVNIPEI